VSIFSSKIICGECGHPFGSKVWHSNDKYRRVIWQCNQKFKDKDHRCETPHLTEDEIKDAFVKALNKFIAGKDNEILDAKMAQQMLCYTSELEKQKTSLENEMEIVNEAAKKLVERNARVTMDQNEFQQEYGDLETRYRKADEQMVKVTGKIETKKRRRDELGRVISLLEKANGPVQEFSERQWGGIRRPHDGVHEDRHTGDHEGWDGDQGLAVKKEKGFLLVRRPLFYFCGGNNRNLLYWGGRSNGRGLPFISSTRLRGVWS
jgi:site-specific DNA recombinase